MGSHQLELLHFVVVAEGRQCSSADRMYGQTWLYATDVVVHLFVRDLFLLDETQCTGHDPQLVLPKNFTAPSRPSGSPLCRARDIDALL